MKIKKVAIVTPYDYNKKGGVETFTKLLKSLLEKNKKQVTVIDENSVKRYSNMFVLFYKLGRVVNKAIHKYDLIICNGGTGAFIRKMPSINIYHGDAGGYLIKNKKNIKSILGLGLLFLFERIAGIRKIKIPVSYSVKEDLRKYYLFNRSFVINNCIDTNIFKNIKITEKEDLRKKHNVGKNKFIIIFTGRYEYMKGKDIIEEIMNNKKIKKEDIEIIITAQKHKNTSNIRFFNNISHQEIHELYQLSDLFLFPTRFEGCSYSLLEAMSCGLPFVISKVGNATDIYNDNDMLKEYILEANTDIDIWVDKILKIKKDRKIQEDLQKEIRKYAVDHFSIETFEKNYMNLIEKIENTKNIKDLI